MVTFSLEPMAPFGARFDASPCVAARGQQRVSFDAPLHAIQEPYLNPNTLLAGSERERLALKQFTAADDCCIAQRRQWRAQSANQMRRSN
jgi:hypothetical protein